MDKDNKVIGNLTNIAKKVKKTAINIQHKLKSQPGNKLNLVAVTGTAGKTTTAHILFEIFKTVGVNIACITSEGTFLRDQQISTTPVDKLTTAELFEILGLLENSNASLVILETPIDLIERHAIDPLTFQATIFTNLIIEDPIADSKAEIIFSPIVRTKEKGLVILNGDDDNIGWVNARAGSVTQKLFAASCRRDQVQDLVFTQQGCAFNINGQSYSVPLLASVNLSNVLLALRFALQYLKPAQVASIISRMAPLPGKMELVADDPFAVVIDEVTNPLVYAKVASSLRGIYPSQPKLISVIGSSSPVEYVLGSIATANSRIVIIAPQSIQTGDMITMNNNLVTAAEQKSGVVVERFTSPEEFSVLDIDKLISKTQRVIENGDIPVVVFDEPNPEMRSSAIKFALSIAKQNECVFISGMGANPELALGGVFYQWSEIEAVSKALNELSASQETK